MTDQELLELAAKADGVEIVFKDEQPFLNEPRGNPSFRFYQVWNPLAENGYALSLAVHRKIKIEQDEERSLSIATCHKGGWAAQEPHDGDPEKATRRAIVVAVVHQYLAQIESTRGEG